MPSRTAADLHAAQHVQATAERPRTVEPGAPVPEAAPRTLARAAAAPGALRPADVLRLQRAIGNRAVGAVLAAGRGAGPAGVQRLVADGYRRAYVSKDWLDTKPDGHDETVREIAEAGGDTARDMYRNLGSTVGIEVSALTQVDPVAKAYDKIVELHELDLWTPKGKRKRVQRGQRKLREKLPAAVADPHHVTLLPGEAVGGTVRHPEVVDPDQLAVKPVLAPNHLLEGESDLVRDMDIRKACALIAIVKGENGRGTLNAKLDLHGNLGSDLEYYRALHTLYWRTRGTQYDDEANLPSIYAEWGYSMVFSGNSSFPNLYKAIRKPLKTGSKYVFAITGHMVYVTMRKQLNPGVPFGPAETSASYFQFHSDVANFQDREDQKQVEYIFEK